MWENVTYEETAVPPGYPEQIDVPNTFLHQIDSPFWIWAIRAVLLVSFLICVLYARTVPTEHHSKSLEKKIRQLLKRMLSR